MSRDIKYIGMDVHQEAIVIAVLNGSGKLVMESVLEAKARPVYRKLDRPPFPNKADRDSWNQHNQQTLAAAAPIFLLYCQPSQLLRLGRPSASKLCRTAFQNGAVEDSRLRIGRLFVFFLRRLSMPVAVFAAFSTLCVLVYMRLEGLRWLDALFWVIHPHSINYRFVHGATKAFSFFVYVGVFTFQVWIAERVLVTIFNRQGVEAWKSMINDVNIGKLRDHFIICGYGQVGRTVFDQLKRHEIPLVLIETDEGLYRELLKDGVMVIHGDAKRHDILLAAGIERARGICIVIDNDADNLYITVTARSLNPNAKIITRAGQQRYASAIRNSGADEVIIPEYEGGLMTGRMIQKYYPVDNKLE